MKKADVTGPAQLAKKLGLEGYYAPKRVSRWLDGSNEPDYESTIKLLHLAGWLNVRLIGPATAEAAEAEQEARRRLTRRLSPPQEETGSG